jgi:hypothetical protein
MPEPMTTTSARVVHPGGGAASRPGGGYGDASLGSVRIRAG